MSGKIPASMRINTCRKSLMMILILLSFLTMGYRPKRIDYRDGRYKNVCKDLKNNVLLYFIFIDSKETTPWTHYDIQSTIDSVRVATQWLQKQAETENVHLNIISDYYIGDDYTTIRRNLPEGNVYKSITQPSLRKGIKNLNKWADRVARIAGSSMPVREIDGIPGITPPANKERLIAYLRDRNQVESVALLFFVNNYFKSDISVQINTMNTRDMEFAIVSYKYPSEIAHNFLHLYGAADLYNTPYRRNKSKIRKLQEEFPYDIMQDPYAKNIWELEMGDYTKYLIGWSNELDKNYEPLLTDRIMNLSF